MKTSTICVASVLLGLVGCGSSKADQLFDGRAGASATGTAGAAGAAGGSAGKAGVGGAGVAGGPTGSSGTSTGQGGTPGSSGSSTGTAGASMGKGGAPPMPNDCASQKDCQQCCDDQTGGVVTELYILTCACDKGAQCEKACGKNVCSSQQPSMQCITCLNGINDGDPCVDKFQAACQSDPSCAAAIPCYQGCP